MTPAAKRPAHVGLERHNVRLAEANAALREAETDERNAASAVEVARDQVREAHDVRDDPSKATSALARAKADAEQTVLGREGVERRVKRAALERETFLSGNGEALLAELEPDCARAVEDLRAAAEALVRADRRWRELSTVVAGHLRAMNLVPHENAPGQHGLEGVVKDVRRALAHEVASPAPTWHRRDAARAEGEAVARLRRERAA